MIFNTLTFILFFLVVLGLHHLPLSWRTKKLNLVVASYIFYAAWNPPFVILLWLSTIVDWLAAAWIARANNQLARRALLAVSMSANLGVLGFFKYGNFFLDNFVTLVRELGFDYHPAPFDIVLPVGISFYTFQTMSYTIDVYLRRTEPCKSFLDFALYVTFFPQLVAGPILRASDFLYQCVQPKMATGREMGWGLYLMLLGLFSKVILADTFMGPAADQVFSQADKAGWKDAWVGALAFSGQIYFDFAGYSLCAIGAALCLGFMVPDNFHFPYAAVGFSDFWRRWHISLSTWLRDYLYIPLGGNRRGPLRTYVNLSITMLLGGLWHGASWHFVVWGGLHGAYLALERLARDYLGFDPNRLKTPDRFLYGAFTFLAVLTAWVFFRAQDIPSAFALLTSMVAPDSWGTLVSRETSQIVVAVTVVLLASQVMARNLNLEVIAGHMPSWLLSLIAAALLVTLFLYSSGDNRGFIYFQF